MGSVKLKWSSLLSIPELDFGDNLPAALTVSDELQLTLAWLTGATQSERKLLRCDNNGALLISDAWNGMNSVQIDELAVSASTDDTFTSTEENRGCLISTGLYLTKAIFYRVSGIISDTIYVPGDSFYWYPHKVATVICETVPHVSGPGNVIGVTTFI